MSKSRKILEGILKQKVSGNSQTQNTPDINPVLNMLETLQSDKDEKKEGWANACTSVIVTAILKNEIEFSALKPENFHILENVWLEDVKNYMDYISSQKEYPEEEKHASNTTYNTLSELLFDKPQVPLDRFDMIRKYLNEHYLVNDKVNFNKADTERLITRKVARIYKTTGDKKLENWHKAKYYVELFYDNIVPAITRKDTKSIVNVLSAFELDKNTSLHFRAINSFEAAIAISYLDKPLLKTMLKEPAANFNVSYYHKPWPAEATKNFKNIELIPGHNMIVLHGILNYVDKARILSKLTEPEHIHIINDLYEQSHLKPLEKVIL